VHLFVAALGYSRRPFVRAFRHERKSAWFDGMEGALRRFGGMPQEVLFDNARVLVDHHDAATREVRFNERLHAFARYWGFGPHACAPYRARTKGKDERGVGYVKRNAIAGHAFDSWAGFDVLMALIEAPGAVVGKDALMARVWGRPGRRDAQSGSPDLGVARRLRRGSGSDPHARPTRLPVYRRDPRALREPDQARLRWHGCAARRGAAADELAGAGFRADWP
jgi:hypothetical protein